MGKLTEQIATDLKTAMKNKEKEKLEALRALKTALHIARTEKSASNELTDEEELKIVQKLVKQRKDSAHIYKQQAREDLVSREIAEAAVLSVYLPKQLTEEELETQLREIVSLVGASGPQDMGKVMGKATQQLAGVADGKMIAQKVKEILGSM
ncbi:MAG: GatB/YqeY domain-containing protein [Bacteroidota bacterium]